jgi:glutamine amidotransferase
MDRRPVKAAIIDYGLGNLFSIKHACTYAGIESEITASKQAIKAADVVILPGVGAYSDAMQALNKLDLVKPLQDIAESQKPLFGICLGQQLLMTESHEFGLHAGLNIVKGSVVRFRAPVDALGHGEKQVPRKLKVPQVGWNHICGLPTTPWAGTPLEGIRDGEYMYFVHSFYVKPDAEDAVLTTSVYGGIEFCSSLRQGNVFACQFHPERSGLPGLQVYRNIAKMCLEMIQGA